eukprot:756463-Hanusia_phi.AAC.1
MPASRLPTPPSLPSSAPCARRSAAAGGGGGNVTWVYAAKEGGSAFPASEGEAQEGDGEGEEGEGVRRTQCCGAGGGAEEERGAASTCSACS